MQKLDNVTLVSVCHQDKLLTTIKAMEYSMSQCVFGKSLVITEESDLCKKIPSSIEKKTVKNKITLEEYNRICIEDLHSYIDTDYCLIVQWDGYVIDGKRWKDQFFEYDYIGSPWITNGLDNTVGNGGFSLRSKKFLSECSKYKYSPDPKDCTWLAPRQAIDMPITPEDWFMCFNHYQKLVDSGIKFPDINLAYKFSVEHSSSIKPFNYNDIKTYKSFGFHGSFNVAGMELLNVR